jgi:hypothetical protein
MRRKLNRLRSHPTNSNYGITVAMTEETVSDILRHNFRHCLESHVTEQKLWAQGGSIGRDALTACKVIKMPCLAKPI